MDDQSQRIQRTLSTASSAGSAFPLLDATHPSHASLLLAEFCIGRLGTGLRCCQPTLGVSILRIRSLGGLVVDDALPFTSAPRRAVGPVEPGFGRRIADRHESNTNRIMLCGTDAGVGASGHFVLNMSGGSVKNGSPRPRAASLGRASGGNAPTPHHRRVSSGHAACRAKARARIGVFARSKGEPLRKARGGSTLWRPARRLVR